MVNHCLVCGVPKTNYRTLLTGMYVAGAWIFAAALFVLVLENRLII